MQTDMMSGLYLPAKFAADNTTRVVILGQNNNGSSSAQIFDENFTVKKSVNIPGKESNKLTYGETIDRRPVWKQDTLGTSVLMGPRTRAEAIKRIETYTGITVDSIVEKGKTIEFYSFSEINIYRGYDNRAYCNIWKLEKKEGDIDVCLREYDLARPSGVIYTGEWAVSDDYDYIGYGWLRMICDMAYRDYDSDTYGAGSIALTQTLFNEDESYEYISPIYESLLVRYDESDRDGDGEIDRKYSQYEANVIGFRIMSESGSVIQEVKFGNSLVALSSDGECEIFKLNGKMYLVWDVVEYRIDNEDFNIPCYTIIYEINTSNGESSVKQVGAPVKSKVYPTFPRRGEHVIVEVGDCDKASEVQVTNLSGQVVYRTQISSGQSSISIPSAVLSKGLNVVTVSGLERKAESTKIIVK